MIELGSGSQRGINDYERSPFACYLIGQNGDPRKPEIALATKGNKSGHMLRPDPKFAPR